MRMLGGAVLGAVLGAALAVMLAWPQSAEARLMDPQGLHMIGVLFVAAPIGALAGGLAGVLVARLTRPRR